MHQLHSNPHSCTARILLSGVLTCLVFCTCAHNTAGALIDVLTEAPVAAAAAHATRDATKCVTEQDVSTLAVAAVSQSSVSAANIAILWISIAIGAVLQVTSSSDTIFSSRQQNPTVASCSNC
jgi:hypothetical protein